LLYNTSNDNKVSLKIGDYLSKYPNTSPKECCRILNISHKVYGNRVRQIKHRIKKRKESIVPVTQDGRVVKAHKTVHHTEYNFKEPMPESYILVIEEKAKKVRIKGEWYHSPNRNKQLYYFDDDVSIRIYPKSGTCRINARRDMPFEELRVKIENIFAEILPARSTLSSCFKDMINGLQVSQRHRIFPVGPLTPFKNRFYRDSLGFDILSDKSHPEHLEVHEHWPTWIPTLFEGIRELKKSVDANTQALHDLRNESGSNSEN
jgi:hypothetical protein